MALLITNFAFKANSKQLALSNMKSLRHSPMLSPELRTTVHTKHLTVESRVQCSL